MIQFFLKFPTHLDISVLDLLSSKPSFGFRSYVVYPLFAKIIKYVTDLEDDL